MDNLNTNINLPPEQLSYKAKNKEWRKKHLIWADSKTFFNYSPVRKSVVHKKINYDLIDMKLHMQDLQNILNPDQLKASFIPDTIQHYPIINSKLNVLRGEELARVFDFHVVVTNPNAISEIENKKKDMLLQNLQTLIQSQSVSEDDFNKKLSEMDDYFTYQWQDMREVMGNEILNHYIKEYDMPSLFNKGFMDAMISGEEIYHCDIVGGEPVIERLNPLKVRVFRSGYSNRIEDADMIIIEDYWSPGKIIDTFYDVLSKEDMEYLQNTPDHTGQGVTDSMNNIDERYGFVNNFMMGDEIVSQEGFFFDPLNSQGYNSLLPYDQAGNLRVMRVYWKSRRKVKKVKSYNQETGEEEYNFYPEDYVINKDAGEEEQIYWINQAWEGTKIGTDIFVNMRPRPIQYNRLSNPSRCHFGIVGQIYNINDARPLSLVDILKPYNYMYDAVHDRLNKLIARNWGKIVKLDLAMVPDSWDIDKWMYYARVNNMAVMDSFNEGKKGAATGKLAGSLNNNSNGVIDADTGDEIQYNIQLLQFIQNEMSEACGITPQREGQIANRETVGGVERSTLQSSHITEWLFSQHDNLKKRVLECFLETSKIALLGRNKKFEYITSEGSKQIMNIDGDLFSENDYGLVVDSSQGTQILNQKLDSLAQAGLQNQMLKFSDMMKLYGSSSLSEKTRMIENAERKMNEQQQQAQQQQMQAKQQQIDAEAQQKQMEMQQQDTTNQRDNDTRILVAKIQAQANIDASVAKSSGFNGEPITPISETDRKKLDEQIRQFDQKNKLEHEKLQVEKEKIKSNEMISRQRNNHSQQ